jgi:hypothetical protein
MASLSVLLAALLLTACATRSVETRILNVSGVEVFLRHRLDGGQEVARDYTHPVTISAERLSVILSQIEIESDRREGILGRKTVRQRQTAIPTPLLATVAGALAKALAQAGPNQEIALRAIHKRRKLGVLQREFATGFTAFANPDGLHLNFAFVDWEVPLVDEEEEEEEALPMPGSGELVMAVHVLPSPDMQRIGSREVAVDWRSPVFDHPESRMSEHRSAPERRPEAVQPPRPAAKQPPAEAVVSEPALPLQLSSETLRELADLEEARESGEVSESYYRRQREKLLSRGNTR